MRYLKKYTIKTVTWLQGTVSRINALRIGVKYELALWLERKFSSYSKGKAIMLLMVFCLATSAMFTVLIVNGLTPEKRGAITIQRFSKVRPASVTIDSADPKNNIFPKRLEAARKYLDSLAKDPKGKPAYDSLIKARPGLMDSLSRAEYYYKQ